MTLIGLCRSQYRQHTGRELTDDNVWIRERRRAAPTSPVSV
jgi:hypothetical protein